MEEVENSWGSWDCRFCRETGALRGFGPKSSEFFDAAPPFSNGFALLHCSQVVSPGVPGAVQSGGKDPSSGCALLRMTGETVAPSSLGAGRKKPHRRLTFGRPGDTIAPYQTVGYDGDETVESPQRGAPLAASAPTAHGMTTPELRHEKWRRVRPLPRQSSGLAPLCGGGPGKQGGTVR